MKYKHFYLLFITIFFTSLTLIASDKTPEEEVGFSVDNSKEFFKVLDATRGQQNQDDLENTLNYSLDLTVCKHQGPGSIIKFNNGKTYEVASTTLRIQIIEYYKNQIGKLKALMSKNSNKTMINQKKIYEKTIHILNNVIDGFKLAKTHNNSAITQYQDAYSKAVEEAEHDKALFNECGASLIVDTLNSMEHVRYFYPRQVSDGSAKTFESGNFGQAESGLTALISAETLTDASTAFTQAAGGVGNLGQAGTLQGQKAPDGIGFMIDARLRAFWACGMGSSISYAYLAWARKSQKLGSNSVEQLANKKRILAAASKLLGNSCEAITAMNFHPAPTASKVCSAWIDDTKYFSASCVKNDEKWQESHGSKYLAKVLLKGDEALRSMNEKVEMTSYGRKFVIQIAEDHAKERNTNLEGALKSFTGLRDNMQASYNALLKIGNHQNNFKIFMNKIKMIATKVFHNTNIFISTAYAEVKRNIKYITKIFPSGKANRCQYPAPSGDCYSLYSHVDAWIFPSFATSTSNRVDYISAQLGDALSGQKYITPNARKLSDKLQKHKKFIQKKKEMAMKRSAKKYPNGIEHLKNLHKLYRQQFKQIALSAIKKEGLVADDYKIKLDNNINMASYTNYYNERKKESTKLKVVSIRLVNNRKPANVFTHKKASSYTSSSDPDYKINELTIHTEKESSIFRIISSRYIKKYVDIQ